MTRELKEDGWEDRRMALPVMWSACSSLPLGNKDIVHISSNCGIYTNILIRMGKNYWQDILQKVKMPYDRSFLLVLVIRRTVDRWLEGATAARAGKILSVLQLSQGSQGNSGAGAPFSTLLQRTQWVRIQNATWHMVSSTYFYLFGRNCACQIP